MLIILYSLPRICVQIFLKAISGFRRDANKICVLLGYYAAYSVNSLPMFRGNLTVPLSMVKKSNIRSNHLKVWGNIYMSIKGRIQKFLLHYIYLQRYTATVSNKMLGGNFKIQPTVLENISKQVQARSFNVSLKYPLPSPGKWPSTCNHLMEWGFSVATYN